MKKMIAFLFVTLTLTGCLTRAPTDYELDKRAGLTPPVPNPKLKDSELTKFSFNEKNPTGASLPNEYEKRVEKTWIYERPAGGGTLQGTWFWMEVASAGCECDAPYLTKTRSETTRNPGLNSKKH